MHTVALEQVLQLSGHLSQKLLFNVYPRTLSQSMQLVSVPVERRILFVPETQVSQAEVEHTPQKSPHGLQDPVPSVAN